MNTQYKNEMQAVKLMILGAASELSEYDQACIEDMMFELRKVHGRYDDDVAAFALGLFQSEVVLKE